LARGLRHAAVATGNSDREPEHAVVPRVIGRSADTLQFHLGLSGAPSSSACHSVSAWSLKFVGRSETRWLWLLAASGWLVGGLLMSEVVFATAASDEIEPMNDGLAFDEDLRGASSVAFWSPLLPAT
jgi:hypothetical protein